MRASISAFPYHFKLISGSSETVGINALIMLALWDMCLHSSPVIVHPRKMCRACDKVMVSLLVT